MRRPGRGGGGVGLSRRQGHGGGARRVEAYVHSGGQYEWDSCAPVAVAIAAGLHASRIDGTPLRYNSANPYLPDLVICRAELAEAVLAALAG